MRSRFEFGFRYGRVGIADPILLLAALTLTASVIDEGAAEDTAVGAVVGLTSGSTWDITGTAGGRFKKSGGNIVAGATATDYGAATSHDITLTETLAGANNTPRDTVITITVVDIVSSTVAMTVDFSSPNNEWMFLL